MILINVASRIRQAIQDESFNGQIDASIDQLRKDFMHPEFKALLETVGPNGEFIDSNMGRTINPGHCIETAWFLLEEAKYRNWDKDITELALTILDWVLGVGMGQRIRRYHQLQRLQEPSATGLFPRP